MTKETNENQLLDWTSKQGRILTAEGKAELYYTSKRGYPFEETELPHHHLLQKTTQDLFWKWSSSQSSIPICGAWKRPLFVGEWEHSTEHDELVYNIQTNTLFIDLRIPTTKKSISKNMSDMDLRLYARQHAFAGFTYYDEKRSICTRHHCIDWNFVGKPRNRPNKWYVQMKTKNVWKELSYARDDNEQHYYWERWERLKSDENGKGLVLAMRKSNQHARDAVVVVVGGHFNFIHDRHGIDTNHSYSNLVDLVDASIENGNRNMAESYLSMDAGHGMIHPRTGEWLIDCAIQSNRHGTNFLHDEYKNINIQISSLSHIWWNNEKWDILECNLKTIHQLCDLFQISNTSRL